MAQDSVDRNRAIAKVVDTARTFDLNLRNFVCRQSVQRLRGQSNDGPWSEIDRYEDEVAYIQAEHQKSINKCMADFEQEVCFGAMRSRVFAADAADTKAEAEWLAWMLWGNGKTYVRGYSGLVWADLRYGVVPIGGVDQCPSRRRRGTVCIRIEDRIRGSEINLGRHP